MSDFITELRREVVGAHGAHARRAAARAGAPAARWRPARSWARPRSRPCSSRSCSRCGRSRRPSRPRAAGDQGRCASAASRSTGCSPAARCGSATPGAPRWCGSIRTRGGWSARIPMTGNVRDIAAGEAGLWVRTAGSATWTTAGWSRIDPRTNRIADVVVTGPGDTLAVGGGALWVDRRLRAPRGSTGSTRAAARSRAAIALRDTEGISRRERSRVGAPPERHASPRSTRPAGGSCSAGRSWRRDARDRRHQRGDRRRRRRAPGCMSIERGRDLPARGRPDHAEARDRRNRQGHPRRHARRAVDRHRRRAPRPPPGGPHRSGVGQGDREPWTSARTGRRRSSRSPAGCGPSAATAPPC